MKYIDTHCHLNGKYYKENVEEAIKSAKLKGVKKIILPGTCIEDSYSAITMARNYEGVYAMAGIHPTDVTDGDTSYLDKINPKDIIGIGEVGIDLYRESNPPLVLQKKSFIGHIEYALKHDLPVIIHMRKSEEEVFNILKKYPNLKFLMHSFSSSLDWAKKFIEIGGLISISGIVTFKNAKELQEVVKGLPIEKLVTETDAPFLTPVPHRGKHNKPEFVAHVADYIAEIKKDKSACRVLYDNALKFFNIKD